MKRPNILVFMTDQQRADSLDRAITPNLDRFRQEGITFTNSYTISPHCCPSRATFFSGLYPSQHGVWNNVSVGNTLSRGLYEGVRLFSEDLKESGYRMYFSGKWHVSELEGPSDRGFDVVHEPQKKRGDRQADDAREEEKTEYRHVRPTTVGWKKYEKRVCTDEQERRPAEVIRPGYPQYIQYGEKENPYQDGDVIDAAVEDLLHIEHSDQPWFYYVGPKGPHDPYFPPKEYLDLYDLKDIQLPESFSDRMEDKPGMNRRVRSLYDQLSEEEQRDSLRHYLAFCTYEDALFGRLLDALDKRGERENTVVIFMSDHGDYTGEHGLWAKGLPCFRGAYHIPTVVRWPQGIKNPGSSVDSFITLADFAPTFCELAGIEWNSEGPGRSLTPFIAGEAVDDWKDELYTQTNGNELYGIQRSVMTRDWKYVFNGFDFDELYDLKNDPDETVNLIGRSDLKPVVKELSKKMWQFAYENDDVCINPYIFVGLAPYGPGIIREEDE